jgi:hypothetical protein
MASKRETALLALETVLANVSGPDKKRNTEVPETVPANGLIIMRDGDPGEPVEETLSPHTYHYQHAVPIEVYYQHQSAPARDAGIDAILLGISQAVNANPTLGGAVALAEVRQPDDLSGDRAEGGNPYKRALPKVILHYDTTDPLG